MVKDFDTWNNIKKNLDLEISSGYNTIFPREGDVWVCTVGLNLGKEQDGSGHDFSRPVVVIRKFSNDMFWTVPLSSKQQPYDFYYNFTDIKGGNVSAIISQLKLTSIKRFRRFMYEMPRSEFSDICKKIHSFVP